MRNLESRHIFAAVAMATLAIVVLGFVGCHISEPNTIYVDDDNSSVCRDPNKNADQGTHDVPLRLIGEALEEAKARRSRQVNPVKGTITIVVRPGTYRGTTGAATCALNNLQGATEKFPLKIDESDLVLSGSTELILQDLPNANLKQLVKVPSQIGQTITRVALAQGQPLLEQATPMLLVTPANAPVRNVKIERFLLDGAEVGKMIGPYKGTGVHIDRASDVTIWHNAFQHFANGLRTRGTGGTITIEENLAEYNLGEDGGSGLIASGTPDGMARVIFVRNTLRTNYLGILLVGMGTYKLSLTGANPPKIAYAEGDIDEPNKLSAVVDGNYFVSNVFVGLRAFPIGQAAGTYDTTPPERTISTKITLTAQHNVFSEPSVEYAVSVDAGFPVRAGGPNPNSRTRPSKYRTDFVGFFEKNHYVGEPLRARAFVGFMRLQSAMNYYLCINNPQQPDAKCKLELNANYKTVALDLGPCAGSRHPLACWVPLEEASTITLDDPGGEFAQSINTVHSQGETLNPAVLNPDEMDYITNTRRIATTRDFNNVLTIDGNKSGYGICIGTPCNYPR